MGHLRRCWLSLCPNRKRKEMARGVQSECRAKSPAAAVNRLDGFGGLPHDRATGQGAGSVLVLRNIENR